MNCHVEVTLNLKGAPPRDCDEREPPARPNHPVLDRAPFHSKRSKNANEEPVRRLVAYGLLHSSFNRVSVMKENIVIKVTKNKKNNVRSAGQQLNAAYSQRAQNIWTWCQEQTETFLLFFFFWFLFFLPLINREFPTEGSAGGSLCDLASSRFLLLLFRRFFLVDKSPSFDATVSGLDFKGIFVHFVWHSDSDEFSPFISSLASFPSLWVDISLHSANSFSGLLSFLTKSATKNPLV